MLTSKEAQLGSLMARIAALGTIVVFLSSSICLLDQIRLAIVLNTELL